eukprot:1131339-Rhodomonas_salina.1
MAPKDRSSSSGEDGPIAQSPAALPESPAKMAGHGHVASGSDVSAGRGADASYERPNFLISHSFHEVRTHTVEKSWTKENLRSARSWNGTTGLQTQTNAHLPAAPSSTRQFTGAIGKTAQIVRDGSETSSDPSTPEGDESPEKIGAEDSASSGTSSQRPGDGTSEKAVHYSPGLLFVFVKMLNFEEYLLDNSLSHSLARKSAPCPLMCESPEHVRAAGILWLVKGSKLIVAGFQEGSEAKEKGVRPGDILRRVDGEDYLRTQINVANQHDLIPSSSTLLSSSSCSLCFLASVQLILSLKDMFSKVGCSTRAGFLLVTFECMTTDLHGSPTKFTRQRQSCWARAAQNATCPSCAYVSFHTAHARKKIYNASKGQATLPFSRLLPH